MKEIIDNLNGYFLALRRLTNNKCDYWANLIEIHQNIDLSIDQYFANHSGQSITSKNKISFNDVEKILDEYIYTNITVINENHRKLFAWDIVEYYGLASTSNDPEGEFNPLVSRGAIRVDVQSSFHIPCVCYIVEIGNFAIITCLGERVSYNQLACEFGHADAPIA
jgi:hypothetical protein